MTIGSWMLLAILCWLFGFFNMWYLEPSPKDKLVYVPKWMFILFGMPKHKDVPITVQPVLGVYLQIMGLTLAIYGILLDQRFVKDPHLSAILGIVLSILFGILASQWLAHKQSYIWQHNNRQEDVNS